MPEDQAAKHVRLLEMLNEIIVAILRGDIKRALALIIFSGVGALSLLQLLKDYDFPWLKHCVLVIITAVSVSFLILVVVLFRDAYRKVRQDQLATANTTQARVFTGVGGVLLAALVLAAIAFFSLRVYNKWLNDDPEEPPITNEALLREWGYPEDLIERQEQLESLTLGPSVTTVRWLSADLRILDLTEVPVRKLEYVSPLLEVLKIGRSHISELPSLPPGLQKIDVSWLQLDLSGLPTGLRKLNLENFKPVGPVVLPDNIRQLTVFGDPRSWLAQWPEKVNHLILIGTPGSVLRSLPTSVTTVEIRQPTSDDMDLSSLPPNVQTLVLEEASIGSLANLPPKLKRLEIRQSTVGDLCLLIANNENISVEHQAEFDESGLSLPRELKHLTLFKVETGRFCGLPQNLVSLKFNPSDTIRKILFDELPRALEILSIEWIASERLQTLPPLVEELSITWAEIDELGRLPAYVNRLDLSRSGIVGFQGGVPATVEFLTMGECPDLEIEEFPTNLVYLDLQGCSIGELPRLPLRLEVLNISRTEIVTLEGVPERLKVLNIAHTPIDTLEELPPYLESLTMHEGQVESLEGMPESVRHLTFVEGSSEVRAVTEGEGEAR